jgi:hypothetical protein
MLVRWSRVAKVALRFAGLLLFIFAFLLAAALTYSTARGYMTWWLSSDGQVAVDGVRSGYLHRNWKHSAVIITRTDSHPPQSYLVGLNGKHMIHCGEWHAPRLLAFSIGDVNPPCSIFSNGGDLQNVDNADVSTLTVGRDFVEFHTRKGKKVTVTW